MSSVYERGSLGWWMDECRGALTWEEVAERAGVSYMTLRRNADNPANMRTTTRTGIERALDWKPGSVQAIIDGSEPESLSSSVANVNVEAYATMLDQVMQRSKREFVDTYAEVLEDKDDTTRAAIRARLNEIATERIEAHNRRVEQQEHQLGYRADAGA